MIRIPCLLATTSLLLFSAVGCTSLTVPHIEDEPAHRVGAKPARCLCLWQPVSAEDPAGNTVRGFGGQVYFFAADSEEPIAVNGNVRVFIFDDIGTPAQQARPKDVQDFDSVVWKSFLDTSQFGANYTVFVPYAHASKYESICSLRLRLDQPDGTQLFSDMATVKIAGEPRSDRSIRKLVSPRENLISPERSRELKVDLQRHDSNDRTTTIGSIKEGNLSLTGNDAAGNQALDDHARLRIERYESRLSEMHDVFQQNDRRLKSHPSRSRRQDISDLMPAIRKVSRQTVTPGHQVTPAAHEVFSPDEVQHVEHANFNVDRSQTSIWGTGRLIEASQHRAETRSGGKIRSFSRPLNRQRKRARALERNDDTQLQALQLARISD